VRELVGAEGVEPVIDWLRASYSAVELRSRELVPPVGIEPIVGRLSSGCSAVELRGHGGKVSFDPLPIQDRFYRPTAGATGFPFPEPALGDDPRSPPYQSGALPLCYAGRNGGQPGA
jgi:hypothetical protein